MAPQIGAQAGEELTGGRPSGRAAQSPLWSGECAGVMVVEVEGGEEQEAVGGDRSGGVMLDGGGVT
jgi:hypothetical protein